MTEKYAGKKDDRRYKGEQVDITYNVKRCIHAKHCVTNLAPVFDLDKRPWINPDGATADEVAELVQTCPSGALHYDRHDGQPDEPIPSTNRVIVHQDGYLRFVGNLEIHGASVAIESETRATLCRCGASANKPFCDNSHRDSGFTSDSLIPGNSDEPIEQGGKLRVTATQHGPIEVIGNFQIEDENGQIIHTGAKTWLCRCGGSSKKPFCDGTHNNNGFDAD